MARKPITTYEITDDYDGKPLAEDKVVTVHLAYKGKSYTLDMSQKNADALDKSLGFLADATPDGKSGQRGTRTRVASDAKVIREWARTQGMKVADRGRIHPDVRAAYEAAQK